jgi:hypothetical protein
VPQFAARLTTAAACAVLLMGAAACGGHDDGGSSSTTRASSPTASKSAPESSNAAVTSVVSSMRVQQAVVYAGGSEKKLRRYATDKALASINSSLFAYEQAGVVFRGRPSSTLRVTGVDMSSKPPTATVTECLDTSGWQAVYKATGKPAARAGQVRRYTVVHTLQKYPGGWIDVAFTADKGHPC